MTNDPYEAKKEILMKAFRSCKCWKLPPGDYFEFGLYQGFSFINAYKMAEVFGHGHMRFYGFDSFKGLPADFVRSEKEMDRFEAGQFSCTEEAFRKKLEEAAVDQNRVTLIPGFYENSLNAEAKKEIGPARASVVWIDCDIYSSAMLALEFMTDFLGNGSFLIFDDWFSFGAMPGAGEMAATEDWLKKHPEIRLVEYHKFHTAGISFLVQKREKGAC
ncbi:MAG: hypothetical protein A2017_07520 [Lentisphaerae bacterium GWF2_44_16]|nr:MAG: hypothetical protein A2017_07520 [Lentisphaerae bacterium GWF2_44_16]